MLSKLFDKIFPAPNPMLGWECEVIQTYDGFAVRRVGTPEWLIQRTYSYTSGRPYGSYYYTWNGTKDRHIFTTKAEAIELALKAERELRRVMEYKQKVEADTRAREAFVEKKVWR